MQTSRRILSALLVVTAIVTLAYWIDYFTGGNVRVVDARWYTAYESSFPAADAWLAATSLIAGIGFWQSRPWAAKAGLLAGSALLYLAGMDITFDLENDLYGLLSSSSSMQFELLINLWSLGLGVWTVIASWRRISA